MKPTTTYDLFEQIVRDLRSCWRFRWRALAVAWLVCALGWLIVLLLPNSYEARALVYVDTSSRLRDVLGTIAFSPDVDSRVNMVRTAMLGRPQLEKVAEATGLINRAANLEERDKLLTSLRERIQIIGGRNNLDRNLFGITYQDADREMSIAVVDRLLNTFVEDVIRQRERGAEAAQSFLREQIRYYSEQLALAEGRLADFKKEHVGLMPGDTDYFTRFQAALDQLGESEARLRVAESRRDELRAQLNSHDPLLPEGAAPQPGASSATVAGVDSALAMRIAELERDLNDMLLRFTDGHPDVIGTREQLARLYEQRDAQLAALQLRGADSAVVATNPVYQNIVIALNAADAEVAAIRGEVEDRRMKVAQLRESVDTMPEVEAELSRLNRDYDNTKRIYDTLVAQLERERLVGEGDEREVVNFEIINPPAADLDPIGPPRGLFISGVLILALGCAGGLAYLLAITRPVFTDSSELGRVVGLPVLGVVSLMYSESQLQARRRKNLAFSAAFAGLFLGYVATFLLSRPAAELLQTTLQSIKIGVS